MTISRETAKALELVAPADFPAALRILAATAEAMHSLSPGRDFMSVAERVGALADELVDECDDL